MTRFIIAMNNATVAQRNAVTALLKAKRWGFWHHFEDFWMVATMNKEVPTGQELCQELRRSPAIGEFTYIIVIRIPDENSPLTHWGFGPAKGWEWTKKYWGDVG